MSNTEKNLHTGLGSIRKMDIETLVEKFGPVGMVKFMGQFDSGYGTYTKERHELFEGIEIETFIKIAGIEKDNIAY